MGYQDKWTKGIVAHRGYRECAARYDIVRDFCSREFGVNEEFTVLDIGANWSYFGLRLTEDFPQCRVVGVEPNNYPLRLKHLGKPDRITLLNIRLHLPDFDILSRCWSFDVVLALSVLHHMSGKFSDRLAGIRSLGKLAIVELATEDSPRARGDYSIPTDSVMLGDGMSHKAEGFKRPIFLLRNTR